MSESCRHHFGTMSEPCRNHVGIVSGPCRNHVGIMSGSCRNHIGLMSESCRNHVEIMSESCRNHFAIISESFRTHVAIMLCYVGMPSRVRRQSCGHNDKEHHLLEGGPVCHPSQPMESQSISRRQVTDQPTVVIGIIRKHMVAEDVSYKAHNAPTRCGSYSRLQEEPTRRTSKDTVDITIDHVSHAEQGSVMEANL